MLSSSLSALSQRVDQCCALVGSAIATAGDGKAGEGVGVKIIMDRVRVLEEKLSAISASEANAQVLVSGDSNFSCVWRRNETLSLPLTTLSEEIPKIHEMMQLEPLFIEAIDRLEEMKKHLPILDNFDVQGKTVWYFSYFSYAVQYLNVGSLLHPIINLPLMLSISICCSFGADRNEGEVG